VEAPLPDCIYLQVADSMPNRDDLVGRNVSHPLREPRREGNPGMRAANDHAQRVRNYD
jgi:hypothetical protein